MYVTGAVATGITLLILAGLKPLERHVVRRRITTPARIGLELDAAVLPVRDVVTTVQNVGLQVERVRLRPTNNPGTHALDLTYRGDTPPGMFVELFESLGRLAGVTRVTSAAALTTNSASNGRAPDQAT